MFEALFPQERHSARHTRREVIGNLLLRGHWEHAHLLLPDHPSGIRQGHLILLMTQSFPSLPSYFWTHRKGRYVAGRQWKESGRRGIISSDFTSKSHSSEKENLNGGGKLEEDMSQNVSNGFETERHPYEASSVIATNHWTFSIFKEMC